MISCGVTVLLPVHKLLSVPPRVCSQSCVSSGGSVVGLMVTSSKSAHAIPRSAAPREETYLSKISLRMLNFSLMLCSQILWILRFPLLIMCRVLVFELVWKPQVSLTHQFIT